MPEVSAFTRIYRRQRGYFSEPGLRPVRARGPRERLICYHWILPAFCVCFFSFFFSSRFHVLTTQNKYSAGEYEQSALGNLVVCAQRVAAGEICVRFRGALYEVDQLSKVLKGHLMYLT